MDRLRHAGTVVALALSATTARAEHDHCAPTRAADATHVTAHLGAIAASYRSRFYEGDYQGGSFGAKWSHGRYEVAARGVAYQIDRNGLVYRGFGDLMMHGAATLFERGAFATGGHFMVMAPTGDAMKGLGMGHWMLMPAAWATWSHRLVTLGGSLGYAHGVGDEGAHAEHGGGAAWPLVEPMSFSELTFDATAMFVLGSGLRAGVRTLGAIPTDDDVRVIGAARVGWRTGRLELTAEAQAGIAGDPVRFRGLVSTAMTF